MRRQECEGHTGREDACGEEGAWREGGVSLRSGSQSDRGRVWIRCSQITRAFLSSHPHTTRGKKEKKTNARREGEQLPTLREQHVGGFCHDQRRGDFLLDEGRGREDVSHSVLPYVLPGGLEESVEFSEVASYLD